MADEKLQAVERAVAGSKRYAVVSADTIRRTAARALVSSGGDVTDAVKRTKRALHEIYGAYLPGSAPNYDAVLRKLTAAVAEGDPDAALESAMKVHASTRERLPHLDEFYREVFRRVPEPATVRDVACGLNPLAVRRMGLPESTVYLASDIDTKQMAFLDRALGLLGVEHEARVLDLVATPVTGRADVTLLLKTIPCLERQQQGLGWSLLESLDSPVVVATFPTKSLGNRSKGMFQTHSAAMAEHSAGKPWRVDSFEIPNELVYVISR
ncbi:Rmt family 16S rRNA (guanine(1405)-N(7))-methyltransferase [Actinokineospora bangkokensis]|uniref:16S rRNA (guanine(1405)-N(7))-methyltransferase n=1 Tax=Actinokineospora bangkokensis TaxID=1193682 RepID=A0A1Q9LBZ2_9PSEU|nr:Rmt family 16S rRNA (guanine(1405)-N(7))-methyltransferase [Actinokineospora bangkokensis]OLR89525.1 16S rRNA methyltransferase [Actinokineospora bangkokensis]